MYQVRYRRLYVVYLSYACVVLTLLTTKKPKTVNADVNILLVCYTAQIAFTLQVYNN
jgi:phage-related protein